MRARAGRHGGGEMVRPLALAVLALLVAAAPAAARPFGAPTDLPGPGGCVAQDAVEGCAQGRALHEVHSVAISPDGRNVYTAAGADDDPPADHGALGVFARNARTGAVRQLAGRAGCVKRPRARDGQEGCATGRAVKFLRFVNVSPDGRFVYAGGIRGISVFARDRRTGAVRQLRGRRGCATADGTGGCALARGVQYIEDIRFTADGRFAYSASAKYDAVAVFRRNRATGALTQLGGRAGCLKVVGIPTPAVRTCASARGLRTARGVTLSPDERFLYVASIGDAVAVFRRDRRTGALRQLGGRRGCVANPATSEIGNTNCTPARGLRGAHRLTLTADGRFAYVAGKRGGGRGSALTAFRVNRRTGSLRQLPGRAGCVTEDGQEGCGVARIIEGAHVATLDRPERTLYVASDFGTGGLAVLRRDRRTGALRQLPGAAGCVAPGGREGCLPGRRSGGLHYVVLSPDGRFAYAAGELSRALVVYRLAGGRRGRD
jgi:DNA-binding beta-propeller fold protein YncE